ncbi:unnamed protein product [Phytophthora fragariaefolia]|uniref:Unnamed protein product n=1 Tax=Phytophthora fragariaefolia TaxID=1490495 RepID=A0A9W6TW65_9STRA|nr:unnamed protein product [Phytophthora fragariaefolia]
MAAIDAAPPGRWAFLYPWCRVLGGKLHLEGRTAENSARWEYHWVVVRLPHAPEQAGANALRRIQEALDLLARVALMDNAAWRALLVQQCRVPRDEDDPPLDGELCPRFRFVFNEKFVEPGALSPADVCKRFFVTASNQRASGDYLEARQALAEVEASLSRKTRRDADEKTRVPFELQFELVTLPDDALETHLRDLNATLGLLQTQQSLESVVGGLLPLELESIRLDVGGVNMSWSLTQRLTRLLNSGLPFSLFAFFLKKASEDNYSEIQGNVGRFLRTVVCGQGQRSDGDDAMQGGVTTLSVGCHDCDEWQFAALCSAIGSASVTKHLRLYGVFRMSDTAEVRKWKWQWLTYALFRTSTDSSVEKVLITAAQLTREDTLAISVAIHSNAPPAILVGQGAREEYLLNHHDWRRVTTGHFVEGTELTLLDPEQDGNGAGRSSSIHLEADSWLHIVSDDNDHSDVVLPGFGIARVAKLPAHQVELHQQPQHDPATVLKALTLSLGAHPGDGGGHVLAAFLELVGAPLQSLALTAEELEREALRFSAQLVERVIAEAVDAPDVADASEAATRGSSADAESVRTEDFAGDEPFEEPSSTAAELQPAELAEMDAAQQQQATPEPEEPEHEAEHAEKTPPKKSAAKGGARRSDSLAQLETKSPSPVRTLVHHLEEHDEAAPTTHRTPSAAKLDLSGASPVKHVVKHLEGHLEEEQNPLDSLKVRTKRDFFSDKQRSISVSEEREKYNAQIAKQEADAKKQLQSPAKKPSPVSRKSSAMSSVRNMASRFEKKAEQSLDNLSFRTVRSFFPTEKSVRVGAEKQKYEAMEKEKQAKEAEAFSTPTKPKESAGLTANRTPEPHARRYTITDAENPNVRGIAHRFETRANSVVAAPVRTIDTFIVADSEASVRVSAEKAKYENQVKTSAPTKRTIDTFIIADSEASVRVSAEKAKFENQVKRSAPAKRTIDTFIVADSEACVRVSAEKAKFEALEKQVMTAAPAVRTIDTFIVPEGEASVRVSAEKAKFESPEKQVKAAVRTIDTFIVPESEASVRVSAEKAKFELLEKEMLTAAPAVRTIDTFIVPENEASVRVSAEKAKFESLDKQNTGPAVRTIDSFIVPENEASVRVSAEKAKFESLEKNSAGPVVRTIDTFIVPESEVSIRVAAEKAKLEALEKQKQKELEAQAAIEKQKLERAQLLAASEKAKSEEASEATETATHNEATAAEGVDESKVTETEVVEKAEEGAVAEEVQVPEAVEETAKVNTVETDKEASAKDEGAEADVIKVVEETESVEEAKTIEAVQLTEEPEKPANEDTGLEEATTEADMTQVSEVDVVKVAEVTEEIEVAPETEVVQETQVVHTANIEVEQEAEVIKTAEIEVVDDVQDAEVTKTVEIVEDAKENELTTEAEVAKEIDETMISNEIDSVVDATQEVKDVEVTTETEVAEDAKVAEVKVTEKLQEATSEVVEGVKETGDEIEEVKETKVVKEIEVVEEAKEAEPVVVEDVKGADAVTVTEVTDQVEDGKETEAVEAAKVVEETQVTKEAEEAQAIEAPKGSEVEETEVVKEVEEVKQTKVAEVVEETEEVLQVEAAAVVEEAEEVQQTEVAEVAEKSEAAKESEEVKVEVTEAAQQTERAAVTEEIKDTIVVNEAAAVRETVNVEAVVEKTTEQTKVENVVKGGEQASTAEEETTAATTNASQEQVPYAPDLTIPVVEVIVERQTFGDVASTAQHVHWLSMPPSASPALARLHTVLNDQNPLTAYALYPPPSPSSHSTDDDELPLPHIPTSEPPEPVAGDAPTST